MASLTSYDPKLQHEYDTSCYNGAEEAYMHELVEPSRKLSHATHTNKEKPAYLRNKAGDAEIDIFSADKYFSGRMDEDDARKASLVARRRSQDKKAEPAQTPSVHSESSWNSQSALLRRQRIPSGSKAKAPKKKLFANLGCKCACSDQDSDHDEDDYSHKAKAVIQSSSPPHTLAVSRRVLGSSQDNGSRSFSLERRMKMLAWDAIARAEETQGPVGGESIIKDTESEASSDLFEIECLSCSPNAVVDGGGDSGCVSPATCHAPSEASVEWSVVTASAADFSVLSDSEDQASRKMLPPRPRKPTTPVRELPKTRYAGILSGCKTQKAVRVAGDAYTSTAKFGTPRPDSFRNMMQFQMDTSKNVRFGSKYRKDLLYIQ